ncbi:TetR/AcrR family transcriptional regulator [Alcaligenes parafaecalis]|uniref:TetR/AcrR family transcriptional regulator n=1 Tax=Alcaligenes parafaecalis TaxID=171260 RepID=A0ABT3VKC6_9BURK|nr:TetR/AcrR family transcriptional regulator [Alcaligenes parafaecalis]MCX5463738.1 TetR/AcrR family transcriptional regulator [Alcaligenes parafaecalis]
MGRVSREQAERNRERVLETACRLFRKQGVEGVSIGDIMKDAGLTAGAFYKQFASKEALVEEASRFAFTQSFDSWERINQRYEQDAVQGFQALMRRYFKHRPQTQSCPILAFSSLASSSPSDAQTTAVYSEGVESLFEQFRAVALQAGAEQSEEQVMLLFAAMLGTGMISRAVGETAFAQTMQAAVLAALPGSESD